MEIQIVTGSNVPIYRQIMDQIRKAIAARNLSVGDQLPSVRALADELVLNHNTVAKAYNQLVHEGVIESRQGRGVFVAKRRQLFTKAHRLRRLDAALDSLVSEALTLGFSRAEVIAALRDKMSASALSNT